MRILKSQISNRTRFDSILADADAISFELLLDPDRPEGYRVRFRFNGTTIKLDAAPSELRALADQAEAFAAALAQREV